MVWEDQGTKVQRNKNSTWREPFWFQDCDESSELNECFAQVLSVALMWQSLPPISSKIYNSSALLYHKVLVSYGTTKLNGVYAIRCFLPFRKG